MSNIIDLPTAKQQVPTTVNGKVPPPRRKNTDLRSREYLTEAEVGKLMDAAKGVGRHGHRDATLILIGYPRNPALSWTQEHPAHSSLY